MSNKMGNAMNEKCSFCNASGQTLQLVSKARNNCGGNGRLWNGDSCMSCSGSGSSMVNEYRTCQACNGSGK